MPMGRPPGSRVVTTVTPVAKRPSSWRKRAGSTPGITSPEELGEDARSEHSTRGHRITGGADHKIREVGTPRQPTYDAVGERGPTDAHADEPLEQPFPEERAPSCLRVRPQGRGRDRLTEPHVPPLAHVQFADAVDSGHVRYVRREGHALGR